MSFSIKLIESNLEIKRKMFQALSKDLNKNLKKNQKKVEQKVKTLIPFWIREQPEVISILDQGTFGSLNAQFGFFPSTSYAAVDAIIKAISDSIYVEVSLNDDLTSNMTIYLQPIDFSNVLSLSEANIQALSGPLPWLYWLLIQGTNTIISGYKYEPDTSGRSGGGTMTAGKAWRVPPQFAGTPENNFITRALQGREKDLSSIMEEALNG